MDGAQDLKKGLLSQVFGELAIMQETEGEAEDRLVVALEQGIEGSDVACQISLDELEIGRLHRSGHSRLAPARGRFDDAILGAGLELTQAL